MDTLYYRKIAQIAHRDGHQDIRDVAARVIDAPTIRKPDRRVLKAWFIEWLRPFSSAAEQRLER